MKKWSHVLGVLKIKVLFLFVFSLVSISGFSQYFNGGQDVGSLKWKSIETIHFEVIYPDHFEDKAHEVAQVLEKAYRYACFSLNHQPKRVSVVLHTGTLTSNAFLGWAPSRMEMYTTPPQRKYSQDWLHQLAIHEYRHMIQLSKLEVEMPQLLRIILGEHAAALITGAYLPFWFLEGDAVATETALSLSGRGRTAEFFMDTKAQLLEKGKYSYEKAYLGSYKDHVPNYYRMGYLMVAGCRTLYGHQFWDDVVSHVARHPLGITSFNKGIKKSLGINKTSLYDSLYTVVANIWKEEDRAKQLTSFTSLTNATDKYIDYKYPGKIFNGNTVALKSTLDEITRIVEIDSEGNETVLYTPGYIFDESMFVGGTKFVWCERMPDLRWSYNDHTRLCVYDLKTQEISFHKFNSRLFAPSLSHDATKVVMVETTEDYQFKLVLFDLEKGEIEKEILSNNNSFFVTPSWSANDKEILVVELNATQKRLVGIGVESEKITEYLPWETQEIIRPIEWNDHILFVDDFGGTDDVFAVDKDSKKMARITSSRFGVGALSVLNNTMTYNNYTSDGFQVAELKLNEENWLDRKTVEERSGVLAWADSLVMQEKGVIDFSELPEIKYNSSRYSKFGHGLNIHSWAPAHIDVDNQMLYPGLTFASQNKLSTMEIVGGYKYLYTEKAGRLFADFKYMGWYPELEGGFETGNTSQAYKILRVNEKDEPVDTVDIVLKGKKTDYRLTVSLPLNFTRGKYYRTLLPYGQFIYTNTDYEASEYTKAQSIDYSIVGAGLYYHTQQRTSAQDIFPDFGVVANAFYQNMIEKESYLNQKVSVSGHLYLPGLAGTHGFKLYGGFQTSLNEAPFYSDLIQLARGYQRIRNDQMLTLKVDYAFPIAYPDLKLSSLAYFKRIKSKLFFDYSYVLGSTSQGDEVYNYQFPMKSTGIELTTDVHFLRFFLPFEIGVRSSYLFDNWNETSPLQFDFLLKMDISI